MGDNSNQFEQRLKPEEEASLVRSETEIPESVIIAIRSVLSIDPSIANVQESSPELAVNPVKPEVAVNPEPVVVDELDAKREANRVESQAAEAAAREKVSEAYRVLPKILPRNDEQKRADAYRDVLRYEAKLGGQLFGPVPNGHRREFFCLDRHTWVWHEEWLDEAGQLQVVTTRYHVQPNNILKTQGQHGYQPLSRHELRNFYHAVRLYGQQVPAALRQRLQTV